VLIDDFAPTWDASEVHQIEIRREAAFVYKQLWQADLAGSPLIKLLLALRSLPALLLHPASINLRLVRSWRRSIRMPDLIAAGFAQLAEVPGRELVLGIAGRFWRPAGNVSTSNESNFHGPVPHGLARAVWNFHVAPSGIGRTILSTETRIIAGDTSSRAKFRLYWFFVAPFSGLIRRMMLNAVRRRCEAKQ